MTTPANMRVLYLEDDADSREMVRFSLATSGIEVVEATSAEQAWDLANQQSFDLYLLDGLLPCGDSLNLCRQLRAYSPSTPVFFYSALGFPTDIENGLAAGANKYLVKPYFGDLSEAILKAVPNVSPDSVAYTQQSEEQVYSSTETNHG